MSDLRPATPIARPATARQRSDAAPRVAAPTPDELESMQRHLVSLPVHEGATIRAEDELGVLMVRRPGSGPEHAYAAMPRWSTDDWSVSLARVRERMRAEGTWPSLIVCDALDRPLGLDTRLPAEGWAPMGSEQVLWVGHAAAVPHLDPGLRVEAVQARSADVHEALERRIFGLPEQHATQRREALAATLASGRLRAYVIRLADEPVAVARLSQGEGVAALVGIGVLPERRRQGLGRLLTIITTRAGLATGNRLVWLSVQDGNPPAAALYAGLGFQPAFRWTRWLHTKGPGG